MSISFLGYRKDAKSDMRWLGLCCPVIFSFKEEKGEDQFDVGEELEYRGTQV